VSAAPGTVGVRLAVLAASGALAAFQWGSLLADPPTARLLGVVAVAVACGWLLSRMAADGGKRRLAAWAAALVAAIAGLVVLGLPVRCIPPWGWDELASGIDTGLGGLGGQFDYPLADAGAWSRLLLVAAFVPFMVGAAVLAFHPGRDRDRVPTGALLLLVAAVAIPAAARPTGAPLLWGAVLLLLAAAWLWGDRARTPPAVALVAGIGVVAIPLASSLAADDPPIDYRNWTLPGPEEGVAFDWRHTYGPIDWPRNGELLFRVHSDRPAYWRAETLDEFYGDVWRRSGGGGVPAPEEPTNALPGTAVDPDSIVQARFEITSLDSPLLITPGYPLRVDGLDGVDRDPDGTTHVVGDPLSAGSSYSLTAYLPNPRPAELRAASRRYRPPLDSYTSLALPDGASLESIVAPIHFSVPLWGHERGLDLARRRLDESAYSQVARLAERLTSRDRNAYDAAVAISNHLRTSYAYDERPPNRRLPLRAFLFRDKAGYCQQFSGAMALMLRMVGIPARVAAGFAPGTPAVDGHGYEVTDLDAHSWVEIYFNGIGWVPFDPTPPTAPAAPEIRGSASFGIGLSAFGDGGFRSAHDSKGRSVAIPATGSVGGGGSPVPPIGLLGIVAAMALVGPVRSLRHRRLPLAEAERREVAELRDVLDATGWAWGGPTTLLIVEGRLRGARRGRAAKYVRGYRRRLYEAGPSERPGPGERRAARRDLTGRGFRARLRLLRLMPPGGPRARR
jgi:transglutaminase-like putative cysteine protease